MLTHSKVARFLFIFPFFYVNFEYDGGENFLRRNLIIYRGKHEIKVITETFHAKSYDQINSQSTAASRSTGKK